MKRHILKADKHSATSLTQSKTGFAAGGGGARSLEVQYQTQLQMEELRATGVGKIDRRSVMQKVEAEFLSSMTEYQCSETTLQRSVGESIQDAHPQHYTRCMAIRNENAVRYERRTRPTPLCEMRPTGSEDV